MKFKTNAHLKDVLGRELINDDNIAIAELVKNSYDADSSEVEIIFLTKSETPRIIIRDNGKGMSKEDIQDKWLNIAYSSKKDSAGESRVFAGSKGIGRFSCDRLGSHLTLYTKKHNSTEISRVKIDWTKFEVENNGNLKIEDIDVSFRRVERADVEGDVELSIGRSGTILVIDQVRESWDRKKLLNLRKQLSRIINPNEEFSLDRFEMIVSVPHLNEEDRKLEKEDRVNGKIENQIFEKLRFETTYIDSRIDKSGEVIKTEIYTRGELVLSIEEKNPFKKLKNIKIQLHYLNPYSKMFFTKTTGYRATEFGSVFLFINGFRVFPYGDPGDDWLGIDKRKQQGHARFLGSREIVGRVDVIDRESMFRQVSSREGLVKDSSYTEAFTGFSNTSDTVKNSFFMKAFKRLEKFVVEGLKWDKSSSPTGPDDAQNYTNMLERSLLAGEISINDVKGKAFWNLSESEKLKNIASSLSSIIEVSKDHVINVYVDSRVIGEIVTADAKMQERILDGLDDYKGLVSSRKVKDVVDKLKDELEVTRKKFKKAEEEKNEHSKKIKDLEEKVEVKASQVYFYETTKNKSNHQLMHLHHQIGVLSMSFASKLNDLRELFMADGKMNEEAVDLFTRLYYLTNRISSVAQYATVANLKNQSAKEDRDLSLFIQEYVSTLNESKLIAARGGALFLQISNESSRWVREIVPIEICMIFDNLFSNAVKAGATRVSVRILEEKSWLVVQIENNGKKMKEVEASQIFEEGFTTTHGSGMGMTHIKNILSTYGAEITLSSLDPVVFELRFK